MYISVILLQLLGALSTEVGASGSELKIPSIKGSELKTRSMVHTVVDANGKATIVDDQQIMLQLVSRPAAKLPWVGSVESVKAVANSLPGAHSDKFTDHSYQTMYGTILQPLAMNKSKIKMLEIGLGCNMNYGPGASVKVWRELFPNADLWEAEYDELCVQKSRERGELKGLNVLIGDQGNASVVNNWLNISGGSFDVIVDDGGHLNSQIKTSFDVLWPSVNPGGVYFLEDLQVGRDRKFGNSDATMVMSDIVQSWTEQLLILNASPQAPAAVNQARQKFPLPNGLNFIFCQKEACAIGKSA